MDAEKPAMTPDPNKLAALVAQPVCMKTARFIADIAPGLMTDIVVYVDTLIAEIERLGKERDKYCAAMNVLSNNQNDLAAELVTAKQKCDEFRRDRDALKKLLQDALRHLKEGSGVNLLDTISDIEAFLARQQGAESPNGMKTILESGLDSYRHLKKECDALRRDRNALKELLQAAQSYIARPQHNPSCTVFTQPSVSHCSCGALPHIIEMKTLQQRIDAAIARQQGAEGK